MPANPDDPDNSTQENLREELRDLMDGLRGDVLALRDLMLALRDQVQALRRKKAPEGLDALLTREEAADRLSISTRTLDDMEDAGEIQAVRIRGRVLYAPATLEAYVRRCAGGDRS